MHTPVRCQANGLPIALLSVVDNQLGVKLVEAGRIEQDPAVAVLDHVIASQMCKVWSSLAAQCQQCDRLQLHSVGWREGPIKHASCSLSSSLALVPWHRSANCSPAAGMRLHCAATAPTQTGTLQACECSRRELALLRALLLRNSKGMAPTAWQQKHLQLGTKDTSWLATFITPVYPECLGDADTFINAVAPGMLQGFAQEEAAGARGAAAPPSASSRAAGARVSASSSTARSSSGSSAGRRASSKAAAGLAVSPAAAASATGPSGTGPASSCRVCGARAEGGATQLMRCSRSKGATDWYCSCTCFASDWPRHKKCCKPA